MSFLLNRDTCIAWILGNKRVQTRYLQHQSDLRVAAPTLTELALWLLRPSSPIRYQVGYRTMMQNVQVLSLDRNLAERAAAVRANSSGARLAPIDLMVIRNSS